nr:6-phosphofructokinase [bacterium]
MAKRIAVLTSGGDAPGMNAAIRAVVRTAISMDMEVFGVDRGFRGLIDDNLSPLDSSSVANIILRGGTLLRTARCLEMLEESGRAKAVETLRKNNIEGVVVIGGDGSFAGAQELSRRGILAIGLPGTIDNDLAYTDWTIGFDTALNTAVEAMKRIRDTMSSHDRVCIVEIMGRHCGDLALYAGIIGGAEAILVPEVTFEVDDLCTLLVNSRRRGKMSSIVSLAEGAGSALQLAPILKERTGLDIRATVLGHLQRGGDPSAQDVLLATRCGVRAVELIANGATSRVVGTRSGKIIDVDIDEALAMKRTFNMELYNMVSILSR